MTRALLACSSRGGRAQILAAKNPDPTKPLVGVEAICKAHWAEYGRNYYARYDYEGVDKPAAEKMMAGEHAPRASQPSA